MSAKLPAVLVALAQAEVGVREEPRDSNCGPRVNQYKAATNLTPTEAWFWCAAFICWLVREALKQTGVPQTKTFKRPTTAGARDFIRWSKEQDNSTQTKMYPKWSDIAAGDILVFNDISHIALAVKAGAMDGTVSTIEGNTGPTGSRNGDGVYRKTRRTAQMRARIRFTV